MLRRCLPESRPPVQHPCVLPQRGHVPMLKCSCWPVLGAALLCVLGLAWTAPGDAASEPPGFAHNCSGFAQDPLLGALWPGTPEQKGGKHSSVLAAMVPRLTLRGKALATYEPQKVRPTAPTLEAVFGLTPGVQREIVETPFSQDARGVVLSSHVLATVAHALTPDIVEVSGAQQANVQTVPLRVTSTMLVARTAPGEEGVPAQVAHVNTPYDLALAQADSQQSLQPLPYAAALSYGTGDPEKPTGGLQAGACVVALVTARNEKAYDTGEDHLVIGKVLAKVPVATNYLTQTKLNVNMFTADLAVQPGDSGSPVFALQGGKPVLVGLVSATMYPTAMFTYVARIDPLLALAEALRSATSGQSKSLLVRSPTATSPEPR
jgi:Trypsin-like peptidase domain